MMKASHAEGGCPGGEQGSSGLEMLRAMKLPQIKTQAMGWNKQWRYLFRFQTVIPYDS
jgi:hypothetical protein